MNAIATEVKVEPFANLFVDAADQVIIKNCLVAQKEALLERLRHSESEQQSLQQCLDITEELLHKLHFAKLLWASLKYGYKFNEICEAIYVNLAHRTLHRATQKQCHRLNVLMDRARRLKLS